MSTFLRDKKSGVSLRPVEIKDAKLCQKWMNDPRNRPMLRSPFALSIEQEKTWIKENAKQKKPPFTIIFLIEKKGKTVGSIGITGIVWEWRSAEIGICIGKRNKRQNGIGTSAYQLLMRHAFEELGLLLIEAGVYTANNPSMKFHESLGFKQIGKTDPKALVLGKRVPIVLYSMTKKRWKKLQKKK